MAAHTWCRFCLGSTLKRYKGFYEAHLFFLVLEKYKCKSNTNATKQRVKIHSVTSLSSTFIMKHPFVFWLAILTWIKLSCFDRKVPSSVTRKHCCVTLMAKSSWVMTCLECQLMHNSRNSTIVTHLRYGWALALKVQAHHLTNASRHAM